MPIYSGTAEVGKIYVGSAEVGKVCNNTGAEIWSSGFEIWNLGATSDYTGGWTLRSSGSGAATLGDANGYIYTYANNTANSYRAYFTTAKIPTSKWNTLTAVWAARSGTGAPYSTHGTGRMALSNSTTIGWYNGYPTSNFVTNFNIADHDADESFTTVVWDISSLTTDYYFCFMANSGVDTYSGYWGRAYLKSLILT